MIVLFYLQWIFLFHHRDIVWSENKPQPTNSKGHCFHLRFCFWNCFTRDGVMSRRLSLLDTERNRFFRLYFTFRKWYRIIYFSISFHIVRLSLLLWRDGISIYHLPPDEDEPIVVGLDELAFLLFPPSPTPSLFSTERSRRNRLAASRILLNSTQKALTSMAISWMLMLLLRISDCRKTHTWKNSRVIKML